MMLAPELAARLGLKKLRRDWRGSCPSCGYPAAFSVRAGDGDRALAWCASCQDRDGLASALARITAGAWAPPVQQTPESVEEARTRKQEAARKLWSGSVAATGTLVDTYLSARCLAGLAASPALRFRDDCYHPQGGRLPAMVALVVDVAGAPIAVHRTYIDRATARKATVEPAKASLGPVWTGAIRLHPLQPSQPLIVAEGIETAASASLMIGAPAWAAISCGNLEYGLVLPPQAQNIIIAADKDDPGEKAAQAAARRWTAEGRQVRIARPNGPGDFNYQLRWDAQHG
jgi:putative DNA primase/helicase